MDNDGSSGLAEKQTPQDPDLITDRPNTSISHRSYKRFLTPNHKKIPHRFTRVRNTYVLPIDEELVRRLQITEDDWVIQEETENGILITFSEHSRITDTR
jgi:hypothetical protein